MRIRKKSPRSGKKSTYHKLRRIFLWIVIVLILLAGILVGISYYYGNHIVKKILIAYVSKSSNGLYGLTIKNLYFDLFTGNVNVSGLDLIPDTALYNQRQTTDTLSPMLIELHLAKLQVHGLDFPKLIRGKAIYIRKIVIGKPDVILIVKQPSLKHEKKESDPKMLSIPLPKGLESMHILEMQLNDGKLTVDNRSVFPAEKFFIPALNVKMTNILVDSVHKGLKRIFNSDDIRITLKGISTKTKDGMYTIMPGEIHLSTKISAIWIRNFHLKPNYSEKEFSKKLGYQIDRMDISIKKISLRRINLRKLIINHQFKAGLVTLDSLLVNDYRDKRIPMRPGFKPPMPQQALLKSIMYIKIDSVRLTNGKITYSEQVNDQPGMVFFDKMNGSVLNVTNDTLLVRKNTVLEVNVSMYLMGKGLLNTNLNIPLGAKKDAFTFSATLSKMDLKEINPMLTKLVPAEITSGKVVKMVIASVKADDNKAIGKMDFYYDDLTVKMNSKKEDLWSKIKTGAITVAANAFISKSNPGKDGSFTEGIIYFERDKQKSIFNFLWKSAFSGIKSTIGINKKEQQELKKAEKKK